MCQCQTRFVDLALTGVGGRIPEIEHPLGEFCCILPNAWYGAVWGPIHVASRRVEGCRANHAGTISRYEPPEAASANALQVKKSLPHPAESNQNVG